MSWHGSANSGKTISHLFGMLFQALPFDHSFDLPHEPLVALVRVTLLHTIKDLQVNAISGIRLTSGRKRAIFAMPSTAFGPLIESCVIQSL